MLRTILLVLALLVLLGIGLVYFNVLGLQSTPDGGAKVTVNSVEVGVETRNVNVPVPVVRTTPPGNGPQPAPQPAP